ncbi:MAG: universal stress protein [Spirochaetota bacterium]|nr:universal stress protein [Spirochaetota bacterium]
MSNINLDNILCPIDFSEYSLHALKYARTLAETFKSSLHVLHILPQLPFSHVPYHYHEDVLDLQDRAEISANEELERLCAEHIPQNLTYKHILIKNEVPHAGIIEYAKSNSIVLIVIATHGYGGLRHAVFGSTTERVVRTAPCPVLSVKHPEHDFIK